MSLLNKDKRHPGAVDTKGEWVMRGGAADIMGITQGGMLLLQRDKVFKPDCSACGRIRWRISDCYARRDELRAYLLRTYPNHHEDLVLSDIK